MQLKKSLGQHLLKDRNLLSYIVRRAGVSAFDAVLEIGAGPGNLTLELLQTGASVLAVEVDEDLAAELKKRAESEGLSSHLKVVVGDAMDLNIEELVRSEFSSRGVKMVSNLPYRIAQRLLITLLMRAPSITYFFVMVQKEVGERLAAVPGSRKCSLATVLARSRASILLDHEVPPEVFVPRPRVNSVLLEIVPYPSFAQDEVWEQAEKLARRAFSMRRKRLKASIASLIDPTKLDEALLLKRPEELSLEDWRRLGEVSLGRL